MRIQLSWGYLVLLLAAIVGCKKGEGSGATFQTVGRQPDLAPVMLNKELPFRYPPALYAQKVQGNVTLRLFIDRDLTSFVNRGQRVIPEVLEAAPVTLSLVLGAAFFWVVGSIAIGVLAAAAKDSLLDRALMVVGLIGISMPVYWLGEVVNLVSQSRLHDSWLFSWVPPLWVRQPSRPAACSPRRWRGSRRRPRPRGRSTPTSCRWTPTMT